MKTKFLLFLVVGFISIKSQAQTIVDSVFDYDGNVYNILQLGNQYWFDRNLRVTHYSDGTQIPNIVSSTDWSNLTSGAYCNYDNSPTISISYGCLYNWYAVTDSRKLCPSGCNVPSDDDWSTLIAFLGGESISGGKLKSTGTFEGGNGWWYAPNTGATNSSGFTTNPAGYRSYDGTYEYLGYEANFFSSTEFPSPPSGNAYFRGLLNTSADVSRSHASLTDGLSIRCVCPSVSINEIKEENKIQISPNPVKDKFTLDCRLSQSCSLSIINSNGDIVLQKQINYGSNKVDISSLSQGIYIINITDGKISFQKKIIKD